MEGDDQEPRAEGDDAARRRRRHALRLSREGRKQRARRDEQRALEPERESTRAVCCVRAAHRHAKRLVAATTAFAISSPPPCPTDSITMSSLAGHACEMRQGMSSGELTSRAPCTRTAGMLASTGMPPGTALHPPAMLHGSSSAQPAGQSKAGMQGLRSEDLLPAQAQVSPCSASHAHQLTAACSRTLRSWECRSWLYASTRLPSRSSGATRPGRVGPSRRKQATDIARDPSHLSAGEVVTTENSTISLTHSGCFCEYASPRVEPQEPPRMSQRRDSEVPTQ